MQSHAEVSLQIDAPAELVEGMRATLERIRVAAEADGARK